MDYYNAGIIYKDKVNNDYYQIINPITANDKNTYNINSYFNQNYNNPLNQPQNYAYYYLTTDQNAYQNNIIIPNEFLKIQNVFDTPRNIDLMAYNLPYQTSTNTNNIYPKQKFYNNKTLTNNLQQQNNKKTNKIEKNNPIQKASTMFQKPSKNMYYFNIDGTLKYNEITKVNNENNTMNNINLINNNTINIEPQNNPNRIKNIEKNIKIENSIINPAVVTKIEKANNHNLKANQTYQNNFQVKNSPTIYDEFKFDNINYNNIPDISQSTYYSSKTHKIPKNYNLNGDIIENNKIIKENENSSLVDQYIYLYNNYENNQNSNNQNQIIYQTQSFNDKNYNNSINNIYFENQIPSELRKVPEIQKEIPDNSNNNLLTKTTVLINPQSPFFENNGEIISNSNSTHYFRQTNSSPVKSYGYCQNQGKRSYMEDEGKVIENLNGDPNKILFCLFDGHGGGQVSKYLQENFGTYMKKILDTNDYINGFKILFEIIDEDIKKLNCPSVGSTATIVFIEKKENKRFLYCANIGDSRCVLVNKNAIYRLSYDHRVADLKENNRILSGGGIIVNGRVYGILMLSRSFGDFQTKGYGVIVTPHVIKYELKEDDLYCVIASDGVWDVVKDSDCAVLEQMGKMGMNTGELSRRMINEALKRKSKDNVSCFVISLN